MVGTGAVKGLLWLGVEWCASSNVMEKQYYYLAAIRELVILVSLCIMHSLAGGILWRRKKLQAITAYDVQVMLCEYKRFLEMPPIVASTRARLNFTFIPRDRIRWRRGVLDAPMC